MIPWGSIEERVTTLFGKIDLLEDRVQELETNYKHSFTKVENHINRILELINKNTLMIAELQKEKIAELKERLKEVRSE